MSTLDVVILAAGKGTRMKSALPKVLHPVGGQAMVEHVVRTAQSLTARHIVVVLGHGIEQVAPRVSTLGALTVEQHEQRGTGHAVQQALPLLPIDDGRTLVLFGDVPLVRTATLQRLLDAAPANTMALLTTQMANPFGYGRVIRAQSGNSQAGRVLRIVEQKDASAAEQSITEINTGILLVPNRALHAMLPNLTNNNVQREFFLTDLVAMANAAGHEVVAIDCDAAETAGVNDRVQLAGVERVFQRRLADELMRAGVSLADPARLDIRGELHCGNDTFIDANVLIEGRVVIGASCRIGANVLLKDCTLADRVEIRAFSHIEGATIETGCLVGPFARLRPGAALAEHVHVGNFVEIKQATIGAHAKINHLTYLGDAMVGQHVNIGAGTITCNYDGANKFTTRINDHAFIGSNSALVAPITVGTGATVGAGSVITEDVPDGQLAVARSPQKNIAGWQRPAKQKD